MKLTPITLLKQRAPRDSNCKNDALRVNHNLGACEAYKFKAPILCMQSV